MKRFAFWVFVLTAGLVAAESDPFKFNMGADLEYLSLSSDVETNVASVLNDTRTTMNFLGGHAFADISSFVTVSAGAWYGLPGANVTTDAATRSSSAPANTLLLLDLNAVFKYPIAVGRNFTFEPKIGLDSMYYLLGNFGGSSPNTATKNMVSPQSLILGADTDYAFPNGVFLRLPVDVAFALNSRPASLTGKYVDSHTITLRTGISVGYKLLGFDRDVPVAAPKAPEAVSATSEEAKPAPSLSLAAGGGASFLTYAATQTWSLSGSDFVLKQTLGQGGFYGFFDVSDYFTAYAGMLFGFGDVTETFTDAGNSGPPNRLIYWEAGAEVKYPLAVSSQFTVAPKVGFGSVGYLSGKVGSAAMTADSKQLVSPMLITAGADFDWMLNDRMFVRVPADLGWGLNSKLSNSFYDLLSPAKYSSSSTISFRTGASLGYKF